MMICDQNILDFKNEFDESVARLKEALQEHLLSESQFNILFYRAGVVSKDGSCLMIPSSDRSFGFFYRSGNDYRFQLQFVNMPSITIKFAPYLPWDEYISVTTFLGRESPRF